VVPVYGAGTEVVRGLEVYYIALKYIDGFSLSDLVREQGPCDPETATRIVLEASRGLEYAHTRGFVHRDVKPGNVLIDRSGRALIADFGLVRDQSRPGQPLTQGEFIGTRAYAAPEQLRKEPVDARADIFSLGATYLFALSGLRPAQPEDDKEGARTLPVIDPALPRGVRTTLEWMLRDDPNARPATMGVCHAALARALRTLETGNDAARPRRAGAVLRWSGAAVLAAGAVLAGLFLLDRSRGDEPERPAAERTTLPDKAAAALDASPEVRATPPQGTPAARETPLTAEIDALAPQVAACVAEFEQSDAADAEAREQARVRLIALLVDTLGQLDRRANAIADREATAALDRLAVQIAAPLAGALARRTFGPFPTTGGIRIDRYPVTNVQVFAFLLAAEREGRQLGRLRVDPAATPHHWQRLVDSDVDRPRFDHSLEPALGLSSNAIDALCAETGKRLPTRDEWSLWVAPRLAAQDGVALPSFLDGGAAPGSEADSLMERVVWDDDVWFAFLSRGRAVFRAWENVRPPQQALRLVDSSD
jgi:hypothetical protein